MWCKKMNLVYLLIQMHTAFVISQCVKYNSMISLTEQRLPTGEEKVK